MTMRVFYGAVASLVAAATLGCSAGDIESSGTLSEEGQGDQKPFVVTSPNFDDGDALPAQYTCLGNAFQTGVTPELDWTKGPTGTKTYAIVLHDTSLADPNLAYHWAAWNIPHEVRTLPEGIPGLNPADPAASNPFPEG